MENTLENKAKFFGLYYGQQLTVFPEQEYKGNVSPVFASANGVYLELKPLSQITDEDAKEICGNIYPYSKPEMVSRNFSSDIIVVFQDGHKVIIHIKSFGFASYLRVIDHEIIQQSIDELRGKGYALDWKKVSVEQQIEWGWVKLTENPQPTTENQ